MGNGIFKKGDIAYVYDDWWGVCKVEVIKIQYNDVWVNFKYSVDKNGEQTTDFDYCGTSARFLCPDEGHKMYGIWHTAEEVYVLQDALIKSEEEKYRSEINSVKDLIEFPLKNSLCGEDMNYTAFKIYKEKAKELLNVDL